MATKVEIGDWMVRTDHGQVGLCQGRKGGDSWQNGALSKIFRQATQPKAQRHKRSTFTSSKQGVQQN